MKTNESESTVLNSADLRKNLAVNSSSNQIKPNRKTLENVLTYSQTDYSQGRFRFQLYRFLSDSIPAVNSCLNTWVRLSAAPGKFITATDRGKTILDNMSARLHRTAVGKNSSIVSFLVELFNRLYRDGYFPGFLLLKSSGTMIDRFITVNPEDIIAGDNHSYFLEFDKSKINLNRPDFYMISHTPDNNQPLGKSILRAIPFVSYIEQQLVDDMRRTSHNSGYHRLHVKISPPERMSGESDNAYVERINSYFDATVDMIKSCKIDENPVTWENVSIDHIGPENVKSVTNSWFMNHRAMIEEICAGTNLAPFLLGYSFGATTTWASFKFDIVMRQIQSVQAEVAAFLQWLGNIELALHGIDDSCRFEFDNSFAYKAIDEASIKTAEIDNILKLYNAGLIDESTAKVKADKLLS